MAKQNAEQQENTNPLPQDGEELAEGEQEQEQEQQELPKVNPQEAKARQTGWVSKQEWIDQGKDADDWISASRYNEKGEMINTLKHMQSKLSESDQRIADNNAIWAARLEVERNKLVAMRDDAIDNADKKEVNRIDSEIENLDKTKATIDLNTPQGKKPGTPPDQPNIPEATPEETAIENNFFQELGRGKQAFAAQVAAPLLVQGLKGQELVNAVNAEIEKEFPTSNPRRMTTSKTDTRRPNNTNKELSVDNLTSDDKATLAALRRSSSKYAGKSDGDLMKLLRDTKL